MSWVGLVLSPWFRWGTGLWLRLFVLSVVTELWSSPKVPLPRNWPALRRQVLGKSRVCWLCGQPGADEVDHVKARAFGGSDDLSNLRPVHRKCHLRKSSSEGFARRNELRALRKRPVGRHPGSL